MSATGSAAAPERRSKGKASRAARSPGRRAKRSAAPDERAPEAIAIRGAREHNLRNVDLDLPRDQLVVITGLSGSGKSSLAFDTLYAEGQRRYVESLSAYARQFLDQMSKPDVDAIEGLSPAISIEQKTVGRSPRSTVGTTTEISDYLRLLFSRAGEPHCWSCGKPISSQTVGQMAERVLALGEGARVTVLAPIIRGRKGAYKKELDELRGKGFVRARIDGELVDLAETVSLARSKRHDIDVVIDRIAVKEGARARIAESIEAATAMADGLVTISSQTAEGTSEWGLSQANSCNDCGVSFPELAPRMFSFNSPAGACDGCSGLGVRGVFDASLVAPEPDAPLSDAIAPWRGGGRRAAPYYRKLIAALASHFEVDPKTPWGELPERVRRGILFGTGSKEIEIPVSGKGRSSRRKWDGVIGELERRIAADPDELRTLERYQAPLPCEECEGTRLRLEARSVRVGGHALHELCALPLEKLGPAIEGLKLGGASQNVAERVLFEIRERIRFLCDVGLGYLTLDRASTTLSGGESQRIRLATQIGASLMGVLYILDEPSIGLHPRDHGRLLESLEKLRDQGNSILVVEHDEDTMRRADWLVDMGPAAGIAGGRVVAQGPPGDVMRDENSLTGAYLSGAREIGRARERRAPDDRSLEVAGCSQHNLKDVTLRIPIGLFSVVTGVSGSGKSTLIGDTLHRALAAKLHAAKEPPGKHTKLSGLEHIDKVVDVSQAPIGRTPRSNPATYSGALDGIRKLFSGVPEARARGYGPGRFSFNVKGGRCEACTGDGSIRVEMNFLPDLFVTCEVCHGRRYNRETLEIKYKEKSIADVLELTVDEALPLFENVGFVHRPLEALAQVGLGYVHLGQAATTLSGGEAQRIKLARELQKKSPRSGGRTLYLLDEPTTGLHFADIEKLLELLHALVDRGNTVVVVEHQLDVVRSADHVIDLGPEGGEGGGEIVAQGTPEQIVAAARSHTGRALAEVLAARSGAST